MALGSVSEEIGKSNELWGSSAFEELREQQETDFSYWSYYKFKMPEEQGTWDNVTSPNAKSLANKLISLLSGSWMQLYIDVDDDVRKKRKSIANTEKLGNSIIWLADREATSVPSGKTMLQSFSADSVITGGTVQSLLWYEDEKAGKPKCDYKRYHPMFSQWLEGDRELIWFCYRNPVNKYYLKKKYGKEMGKPDAMGKVLTYTFWDEESWKVAIPGEDNWVDEGKHNLGYIPVNIRTTGFVPYMMSSSDGQETMKYSWMSYLMNTRDLHPLESKLMTIEATKAIDSGRKDIIAHLDSSLSADTPQIRKLAGKGNRGEILYFDKAKGHEFNGFVEYPDNQVVDSFLSRLDSQIVGATVHPIAFGEMKQSSGSGTMVAELRAAALEFLMPFRECVEQSFIWAAEEGTKQYKAGKFDKVEVEGRDRMKHKFYGDKIDPKDVDEFKFECELVADRLRDELQELGAAIQTVNNGLSSRRTAMRKHNIVEDADEEMEKMKIEAHERIATNDPLEHAQSMAQYYATQVDPPNMEMYLYHMTEAKKIIETRMMAILQGTNAVPGGGNGGGQTPPGTPPSPQANTARIATEPQGV